MEQSLVSQIFAERSLESTARTAAATGATIDSVNFQSLTFLIDVTSVSTETTVKIQHSDDNANWEDIKRDDAVFYDDGIYYDPVFPDTVANQQFQWGYIGKKRYVRLNYESGDSTLGAIHVLGHPERVPTIGERASKQFPDYPYSV